MEIGKMEELAEKAADAALAKFAAAGSGRCSLCQQQGFGKIHAQHHEFISDALEFMAKLNDIKWGSAKAVVYFLAIGFVLWFFWTFFGVKVPH
jgi:hypothetical protein